MTKRVIVSSSELQQHIQLFFSHYNYRRYHESLDNLTPADVYYGRGKEILSQRQLIRQNTMAQRRQLHYDRALPHLMN